MADRTTASIRIGGTLPRRLIDGLREAAISDGGFADWDETPLEEAAIVAGPPLKVCAHELSGGVFEGLEAFCETHRLPYVRESGSCAGAFGPERIVYTGADAPEAFETTESGTVTISQAAVRRLGSFAAIEALFARAAFVPPILSIVDGEGA